MIIYIPIFLPVFVIDYSGLWSILHKKQMTKTEFGTAIGLSSATLVKLSNNEPVSASTLDRICTYLGCDLSHILSSQNNPDEILNIVPSLRDYLVNYLKNYATRYPGKYDCNLLFDCINSLLSDYTLSQKCNYKQKDFNTHDSFQLFISSFDEKSPDRKGLGVYYTPDDVIQFIIEQSLKQNGIDVNDSKQIILAKILDPTCGCGDFLVNAYYSKIRHISEESDCYEVLDSIYGNDIVSYYSELSKLRLFIAALELPFTLSLERVVSALNDHFYCKDFVTEYDELKNNYSLLLGNPPYVEGRAYSAGTKLEFGNVYADVIVKAIEIAREGCTLGFIIPLSYTSTPRMAPLRKMIRDNVSIEYNYNFNDRPDCLFTKVHQKLTILIATKSNGSSEYQLKTSGYTYWYKSERFNLFDSIQTINNPWVNELFYPKLGNNLDLSIYEKIIHVNGNSLQSLLEGGGNDCIYLNSRATFWIKAFTFNPGSKEFKGYAIDNSIKPYLFSLLNSSLFWWYWTVVSDCWHITNKELSNFIVPITNYSLFSGIAEKLENDLETTKEYVHTKQTEYEYKHKLCKESLSEIDRMICKVFGLSNEETQYIINYQDKYRRSLGQ